MDDKCKELIRKLEISVTVDFLKDLELTKEQPIYYIDDDSCLNLCLQVNMDFFENFIQGFELKTYMEEKRKCSIQCFVENEKLLLNVGDLKEHNFTFGITDKYVVDKCLVKGKIIKVYFVLKHEEDLYYIEQHFKLKKKQKDIMKSFFKGNEIEGINNFDNLKLNFVGDIVKTNKITNEDDLRMAILYGGYEPPKRENSGTCGPEFPIF